MTDPAPSEALYALSRGYPLSVSQNAEVVAHIATLEAQVALLQSDAERIASCPWRVQKGCTALCQPPKTMREAYARAEAAESALAEARRDGERLRGLLEAAIGPQGGDFCMNPELEAQIDAAIANQEPSHG